MDKSKSVQTPGGAWAMLAADKLPTKERCDCGHARVAHHGATKRNNGGNECYLCDCLLYTVA